MQKSRDGILWGVSRLYFLAVMPYTISSANCFFC